MIKKSECWPPKKGFKTSEEELGKLIEENDTEKLRVLFQKEEQLPWKKDTFNKCIKQALEKGKENNVITELFDLIKYQADCPWSEETIKLVFDNFINKEFIYFYVLRMLKHNQHPEGLTRKPTNKEIYELKNIQQQNVQIDEEDLKNYKLPPWLDKSE